MAVLAIKYAGYISSDSFLILLSAVPDQICDSTDLAVDSSRTEWRRCVWLMANALQAVWCTEHDHESWIGLKPLAVQNGQGALMLRGWVKQRQAKASSGRTHTRPCIKNRCARVFLEEESAGDGFHTRQQVTKESHTLPSSHCKWTS